MSAQGTQPEVPGYHGAGAATDAVSVTFKDAAPHAAPAPAGVTVAAPLKSSAPPVAEVPRKWTRFGLLVAALVCALVTIIAQGVLMSHSVEYIGYYRIYRVKGSDVAKAPGLVIATAVLALVLAGALLALLFFPIARCMPRARPHSLASANVCGAVVEVVLVSILVVLWLASMGVAAKTADNLSGDGWDKTWVGSNGAALTFVIISLLLWIAILVVGVMVLVGAIGAWKGHRQAPAAVPHQPAAAYAVPQQPALHYAAPQAPAAYATPQPPAAYATPQQPAGYVAQPATGVQAV